MIALIIASMENSVKRLAIIGGGAAGLAAAIAAGDRARELGVPVEVVVYERDDRVGRSILATGNGRCNFSNLELEIGEYRNADFVKRVFESAGDERFVCDFFDGLGLEWRAEPDGRLYPLANKASVVVDVLRAAVADLGVCEVCEREVVSIEPPREDGKPFTMRMKDGSSSELMLSCLRVVAGWLLQSKLQACRLRRCILRSGRCAYRMKRFRLCVSSTTSASKAR